MKEITYSDRAYFYYEETYSDMHDTDWRNHPEYLDNLMPWSEAVQAECGN